MSTQCSVCDIGVAKDVLASLSVNSVKMCTHRRIVCKNTSSIVAETQ